MMLVVRALVAGLDLIVRPASGHPLSDVKQPLRFGSASSRSHGTGGRFACPQFR